MTTDVLAKTIAQTAGREWVAREVERLLPIYFAPDHTPQQHAAILEAFADVLHMQPRWAVTEALRAWKGQHNRRPTPAELRILAERAHGELLTEHKRRTAKAEPIPAAPTDDQRERVRAIYEAYKRRTDILEPEAVAAHQRLYEPSAEELSAARGANRLMQDAIAAAAAKAKA
jgi:hypothetical protein